MGKYRVCVYAITKNEEKFVDKWVDSMKEADMIVVTDTGSTDKTIKKLKKRGVIVHRAKVKPWRFDVARNISLSHVPNDVDIAVCTDLDEVLLPGWRAALEEQWTPQMHMGNYLYNWRLNPDGTPHTQFTYFKIHKKQDYTWVCPVHEYLKFTGTGPENRVYIKGLTLNHYPDPAKSRSAYLDLLEYAVETEPDNVRMKYYLGREYFYKRRWQECIEMSKTYLTLPGATWHEERSASMRYIAGSYAQLNNIRESYNWFHRAIAECPHMRESYVDCANVAYKQNDWTTTFFMCDKALQITDKSMTYVNAGHVWNETPHDLLGIACYHLGMLERSLEAAKQALTFVPDDDRLKNNVTLIQNALNKKQNKTEN
ncbi:glycosyl transferase [Clostridia bacterium]|nr:glycosyl transferase [Clostridia bacterium]